MIHFKQVVRHIAKKARSNRYRWKKRYGYGGDAETADYVRCYCAAKGCCEYCGERVTFFKGQYDHIYSRAKGGDNSAVNLALCCPNCNERKASKHPAQFAAEQRANGYWTPLIARLLNEYDNDPGVQLRLHQPGKLPVININHTTTVGTTLLNGENQGHMQKPPNGYHYFLS